MISANRHGQAAGKTGSLQMTWLLAFLFFIAAALPVSTCRAQTFAEWFSQKKTQKKYLLQQIAALQVYTSYLKQGYTIASQGLSGISGALYKEFGLHNAYYHSLKTAGPAIRSNRQVAEIVQWQQDILDRLAQLDRVDGLKQGERTYISQVKNALLRDCNTQMTLLQDIMTDGRVTWSDEERLKTISSIHTAMEDNYSFATAFTDKVYLYKVQQEQERNSVHTGKALHGLQ
ncbi:hypothetical protein [Mucilaginibacter segetis]|uniref:Uncharacterized protein n=1 Tax=Mucilaginibacter segetis TaxID=2793071 RepID=A0A934ULG4_9SPHI|nr:hypothetical protein [Mucilaginibacter segetis]MBK0378533.1 hypothetical protein [Mucilaginibacter segetis]